MNVTDPKFVLEKNMIDNKNLGNGTHEMTVPPEETILDSMVWEQPARVRNRTFPGPGLCVRVVRRGATASFTFSPEVVQALGLTRDSRVKFGWDARNHRLGIMPAFGSSIRLLGSGNAEVSKVFTLDILNDLMRDSEQVFFTPVIVPGHPIIVITPEMAHDPWTNAVAGDETSGKLPRLSNDGSKDPDETLTPHQLGLRQSGHVNP